MHVAIHIPLRVTGKKKERITTAFCINAAGKILSPFLIYPEPRALVDNHPNDAYPNTQFVHMKFLDPVDKHVLERPIVF